MKNLLFYFKCFLIFMIVTETSVAIMNLVYVLSQSYWEYKLYLIIPIAILICLLISFVFLHFIKILITLFKL